MPERIFDTELGARLLGFERVGLGAVVEHLLGLHLAKEHSAADWSTRPLPTPWLVYAALDVELLLDVRDAEAALLVEPGKTAIAEQEFESVRTKEAKPAPAEPWRRLSGLHTVRGPRNLAVARALWQARDAYARQIDAAPGRLVPDASLVAAARTPPATQARARRRCAASAAGRAAPRSTAGGPRSRPGSRRPTSRRRACRPTRCRRPAPGATGTRRRTAG